MNLVARCLEQGWGTTRNRSAAQNWYRQSAAGGYFRGAYNYATILSAEGCGTGALRWFRRALDGATQPSKDNIRRALTRHPDARIRALA